MKKLKNIIKSNRLLFLISLKAQKLLKKSISGKGNLILNEGIFINVKYDIAGNDNTITIEKGAVISDTRIFIRGHHHHLIIRSNCKYKGGSLHFEDHNCLIEIGEATSVQEAHIAVTEPGKKIQIGDNCMISGSVIMRTGDSHSILDIETKKRINYAQDIKVGHSVWVGYGSTILKGVKIGDESIVSSGAIVTNEIPANCIAGGIPAKIIKTNVFWEKKRIYDL